MQLLIINLPRYLCYGIPLGGLFLAQHQGVVKEGLLCAEVEAPVVRPVSISAVHLALMDAGDY